jgi:hypothetical protein
MVFSSVVENELHFGADFNILSRSNEVRRCIMLEHLLSWQFSISSRREVLFDISIFFLVDNHEARLRFQSHRRSTLRRDVVLY